MSEICNDEGCDFYGKAICKPKDKGCIATIVPTQEPQAEQPTRIESNTLSCFTGTVHDPIRGSVFTEQPQWDYAATKDSPEAVFSEQPQETQDDLPPLPMQALSKWPGVCYYTADQMREYALQAIAASKGEQAEPVKCELRLDAYYYYGFEQTGVPAIDRILSAVACAGKAYHHTEEWGAITRPYEDCFKGDCPVDWIQNAANDAAKLYTAPVQPQQLSEEEIINLAHEFCTTFICTGSGFTFTNADIISFAKAVKAK